MAQTLRCAFSQAHAEVSERQAREQVGRERWGIHEAVLRVHHDQPLWHALHGDDQQPEATSLRTQTHFIPGFTRRYNITRLIYYEETPHVGAAIAREKQIKGWLRAKKIALNESVNPEWRDLSAGWGDD